MIRRAVIATGLAALAACNRGSSGSSLRLAQPSAVAVFSGYTDRHVSLWPYAAVANSAQDELVLIDAVENRAVTAPVLLRPLSIPAGGPRPALLASASFTPPDEQPPRPSLLVVATAGSSALQLIRTWHATVDPAPTGPGLADEEPVELGSEILALVAAPAVEGDVELTDRVRVVAALAGGDIAVVEYQWSGDPETGSASAVPGGVTRATFTFEGLSLAVDPLNPRYAYAASIDQIVPGVMGVAQLDLQGTPPALTLEAIDAHAPTRLVAAYSLRERALDRRGAYDQYTPISGTDGPNSFQPVAPAPRRVYAWRDPASCGPNTVVPCGIAVLDPVAGDVLEDPWNLGRVPKRYLAPITLPSRPVAMIVGPPAQHPPASDGARPSDPDAPTELMMMNPITPRLTTGVLLLPSEDGRNYFADLARWETPSSVNEFAPASGIGVSSFKPSSANLPRIGFYRPSYLTDGFEAWDANATAASFLQLTPGFTPTDSWTVTFQGYLPDFASSRAAQVESAGAGALRIAFQTVPPGASAPVQVVNVYDPSYGVRVGDIIEFWTDASSRSDTPSCPDTARTTTGADVPPIEGKVVAIEKPDDAHPGGSLVVEKGDCVPFARGAITECVSTNRGPWTDIPNADCWDRLPTSPRQVRIRAGSGTPGNEEFVVVGAATGYAGRAVSSPTPPPPPPPDTDTDTEATFKLTNERETALTCPLFPYPSNPAAVPACEGACRTTCEDAAIARRARRLHNTSIYCYQAAASGSYCQTFFKAFDRTDARALESYPPPEGPALAFSLGWKRLPNDTTQLLVRDTKVTFHTRSGRVPSSRWGGGGNNGPATQPTGGAWFDRTASTSWNKPEERYRFFVPYVGNLVLDVSPAQSNDNTRVLR